MQLAGEETRDGFQSHGEGIAHLWAETAADPDRIEGFGHGLKIFEDLRVQSDPRERGEATIHFDQIQGVARDGLSAGEVAPQPLHRRWRGAEGRRHGVAGTQSEDAQRRQRGATASGMGPQIGQALHERSIAAAEQNGIEAALDHVTSDRAAIAERSGDVEIIERHEAADPSQHLRRDPAGSSVEDHGDPLATGTFRLDPGQHEHPPMARCGAWGGPWREAAVGTENSRHEG